MLDLGVEEVAVVGEAGTFGNAVVVLAGEESGGERGPDGGTVLFSRSASRFAIDSERSENYLVLVEERLVLDLEALTVEGVVLRLLGDGGNEVVLLGDLSSLDIQMSSAAFLVSQSTEATTDLHDLSGGPFTGTPVFRHIVS